MQTWLLPEYIEDILPPEARRIESLRRRLLDLFHVHGYHQVIPPLLEYLPSLLTGTGHDMDLKTFKVVDQLSGRMMGLRADITPQAARVDAHLLNRDGVVRLCYAGSVLHALPDGMMQTREPLQIGAELFGHAGLESDVEIQQLMLKAFRKIGVQDVHLDIGHVGIFQALMERGGVSADLEAALFQALQGKDIPSIAELAQGLDGVLRDAVLLLPQLYGGMEILERAQQNLPAFPEIRRALDDLRSISSRVSGMVAGVAFDLAELRGYHYHSGVVFAAYLPGQAQAVAKGGRYDEVGSVFGRARPATGFSMDLRVLCRALGPAEAVPGILAPFAEEDAALEEKIEALRNQGEVVVVNLPGHDSQRGELNCDRILVLRDNNWQVEKI
ncbi:MAG: ATP phosphoribosyltransferase regulatory subunit [Nitrosomonadales bacterium]|nr:MAG: ATP phosphoribosyltransferase regulatory subunit [Nitrosomonadales bacterium]